MKRKVYFPNTNPYTSWKQVQRDVNFEDGRFVERITYQHRYYLFYRLWLLLSTATIYIFSFGLATISRRMRSRWKKVKYGAETFEVDIIHTDETTRTQLFKDIAINREEPWAQHNFGYCTLMGIGTKKNHKEALLWIQKAAERGHSASQNIYGYCLLRGIGTKKNIQHAIRNFQRALDNNNFHSLLNLAECYAQGIGVTKNLALAQLMEDAATQRGISKHHNALSQP